MADATVTFNLQDALGGAYDYHRAKVWLTFNTDTGRITDENGAVRVGAGAATLNPDGTGTLAGIPVPGVDCNPATFQVKIHYSVPPRVAGRRFPGQTIPLETGDFGWMTITADAALRELEAEQYAPPSYQGALIDQLQGLVDEAAAAAGAVGTIADNLSAAQAAQAAAEAAADAAVDISGIDVDDDIVEILVKNTGGAGPKTYAALTDAIAAPSVQAALNTGTALARRVAGQQADPPAVTVGPLSVATTLGHNLSSITVGGDFKTLTSPTHGLSIGDAVEFTDLTGLFVDDRTFYVKTVPSSTTFTVYKDGARSGALAQEVANPGTTISVMRVQVPKLVFAWDDTADEVASVYKVTEGSLAQWSSGFFLGQGAVVADPTQLTTSTGFAAATATCINSIYQGDDQFEVGMVKAGDGANHTEVYVDHVLIDTVDLAEMATAGISGAGTNLYALPDDGPHLITVRQNFGRPVLGIKTVGAGTLSYPTELDSARPMFWHGNSFTEATGDVDGIGYVTHCAWNLCQWNVVRLGFGGTGYIRPSPGGARPGLIDRYQHDLIDPTPDDGVVIIALGINDDVSTLGAREDVVTAALTIWDAFIEQKPTARLIIVGPFSPQGRSYQPNLAELDAMLAAAAASRFLPFISPMQEDWITGNGRTGAPTGNGNSDIYIGGIDGTDPTHPSAAGHKYFGTRFSGSLAIVAPDLNRAWR